jgi:hypothetical protein
MATSIESSKNFLEFRIRTILVSRRNLVRSWHSTTLTHSHENQETDSNVNWAWQRPASLVLNEIRLSSIDRADMSQSHSTFRMRSSSLNSPLSVCENSRQFADWRNSTNCCNSKHYLFDVMRYSPENHQDFIMRDCSNKWQLKMNSNCEILLSAGSRLIEYSFWRWCAREPKNQLIDRTNIHRRHIWRKINRNLPRCGNERASMRLVDLFKQEISVTMSRQKPPHNSISIIIKCRRWIEISISNMICEFRSNKRGFSISKQVCDKLSDDFRTLQSLLRLDKSIIGNEMPIVHAITLFLLITLYFHRRKPPPHELENLSQFPSTASQMKMFTDSRWNSELPFYHKAKPLKLFFPDWESFKKPSLFLCYDFQSSFQLSDFTQFEALDNRFQNSRKQSFRCFLSHFLFCCIFSSQCFRQTIRVSFISGFLCVGFILQH